MKKIRINYDIVCNVTSILMISMLILEFFLFLNLLINNKETHNVDLFGSITTMTASILAFLINIKNENEHKKERSMDIAPQLYATVVPNYLEDLSLSYENKELLSSKKNSYRGSEGICIYNYGNDSLIGVRIGIINKNNKASSRFGKYPFILRKHCLVISFRELAKSLTTKEIASQHADFEIIVGGMNKYRTADHLMSFSLSFLLKGSVDGKIETLKLENTGEANEIKLQEFDKKYDESHLESWMYRNLEFKKTDEYRK